MIFFKQISLWGVSYFIFLATVALFSACKKNNFAQPTSIAIGAGLTDTTHDINHLINQPYFSIFYKAWQKLRLGGMVKSSARFTVFAPTDSAFHSAGYTSSSLDTISSSRLIKLITYHIAYGSTPDTSIRALPYSVAQKTIRQDTLFDPINGFTVFAQFMYLDSHPYLSINGGQVLHGKDPLKATNGYIYAIDSVLHGPTQTLFEIIKSRPELTFFLYALRQNAINLGAGGIGTQYDDTTFLSVFSQLNAYNPYHPGDDLSFSTVLAPVNQAFTALGVTNIAKINTKIYTPISRHILQSPVTLLYSDFFDIIDVNAGYYNLGLNQVFFAYPDTLNFIPYTADSLNIDWFTTRKRNRIVHGPSHILKNGHNILGINGVLHEVDSVFHN